MLLTLNIIELIIWLTAGVLVLATNRVDRTTYSLCWVTLFLYIIKDVITSL